MDKLPPELRCMIVRVRHPLSIFEHEFILATDPKEAEEFNAQRFVFAKVVFSAMNIEIAVLTIEIQYQEAVHGTRKLMRKKLRPCDEVLPLPLLSNMIDQHHGELESVASAGVIMHVSRWYSISVN
jgi:hypothetical protein